MSDRPDALRIAVAQPRARDGEDERVKMDDAVATIAEAGRRGVELLTFPEAYPGPIRAGGEHDAMPAVSAAAAEAGCAVCWSRIERGEDELHRTVAYLHDGDGSVVLRYERSHPATGDVHPVLSGVPMAPGAELALAELAGIRVGVLICSELWIPEIARSLAASEEPGLVVADADLERARWLRATDDSMEEPKPFDSLPGLIRARRPDLYGALTEPRDGLYDYDAAARSRP